MFLVSPLSKKLTFPRNFSSIFTYSRICEFSIFCKNIWIESLYMTICFGRFDSEISDLKKTHTTVHSINLNKTTYATLILKKFVLVLHKVSWQKGQTGESVSQGNILDKFAKLIHLHKILLPFLKNPAVVDSSHQYLRLLCLECL